MVEYRRARHRLVARVLDALDADVLARAHCYFGGGTRIALELDEYRESEDIDFLCSDLAGYRSLRAGSTKLLEECRIPKALCHKPRNHRYKDSAIRIEIICKNQ